MEKSMLITICAIAGFLGFWFAFLFFLKRFLKKRVKGILDKFKGRRVLKTSTGANFFGQESLGQKQVRGNGVLILTEEELYFEMWMPKREFQIPVSSIVDVETPKSHLHKTKLQPLLKVIFRNRENELDSFAWLVRDLSGWKDALLRFVKNE